MQIDATGLMLLLFDRDPATRYLARVDLYLSVSPYDDRREFLERELTQWLARHESFLRNARAQELFDDEIATCLRDFACIMRGLVSRRRNLSSASGATFIGTAAAWAKAKG
jgi:hypothetical protein